MQASNASRHLFPGLASSAGLRALLAVAAAAALVLATPAGPAHALEPGSGEEAAIKTCEQRLCAMVLGLKPTGDDLQCDLAKTWDRDTLKKGESSSVQWGFGDARCEVDLAIDRANVIAALTDKKHVVQIPEHTVACTVEREGKPSPVTAKLAPKLSFKNGKADKIWINLIDIDGPQAVTATVWMAAKLEDNLGIFHKSMIKSVNKFLHKKCGERYYADGRAKPELPKKKKKDKDEDADEDEVTTKSATAPAKPAAAKPAEPKAVAAKKPPTETGSTPPSTKAPIAAGTAENK